MCRSIHFETDCEKIPIQIFWSQFCNVINQVIPPEMVRKYIDKPIGISYTIQEISYSLRLCTSLPELAEAIANLPETKKHSLIWDLFLMSMEIQSLPPDTYVCVPKMPDDYIKPFFEGKLTISNILC